MSIVKWFLQFSHWCRRQLLWRPQRILCTIFWSTPIGRQVKFWRWHQKSCSRRQENMTTWKPLCWTTWGCHGNVFVESDFFLGQLSQRFWFWFLLDLSFIVSENSEQWSLLFRQRVKVSTWEMSRKARQGDKAAPGGGGVGCAVGYEILRCTLSLPQHQRGSCFQQKYFFVICTTTGRARSTTAILFQKYVYSTYSMKIVFNCIHI